MVNIFENRLIGLLKKDLRFVDEQTEELIRNEVVNGALKMDKELISILLEDKEIKSKFFSEIKGHWIFNTNQFISYIQDKNFLSNSYTKFKNKIGLNIEGKFLNERKEVSLVWPFKDCILEGGMTKEDEKQDEIFFNEILAHDEIDRLLDTKVLTNFKRFTTKGEEKVKNFNRHNNEMIKENLIIKGNNLIALHSLRKEFTGKVKLVYIDPPYNTKSDSFSYNDTFNHSSWLTFMKNRLEIARELMNERAVIFVHCDDNEQAYLKVLMDEIFGKENFIATIVSLMNRGGRDYGGIARTHDYIQVYGKTEDYEIYDLLDLEKEFPYQDEKGGFEMWELRNRNVRFNDKNRPNLCYPFYVNLNKIDKNNLYELSLEKKAGWIEVMPKKSQGIQTVWRWGKEKAGKELNNIVFGKKMQDGNFQIIQKYREKTKMARSIWDEKEMRNEKGTLEIKELFNNKVFDYPKSEELLKKVIEIGSKKGDIVLDFCLGSGTTSAVAHKMERQYIGVEQMDYIEKVTLKRLGKVIDGEKGGISELVNWKGGGNFIYCELMKWNEEAIDKIQDAKETKTLLKIWGEMCDKYFLNYDVDIKKFNDNKKGFESLTLKQQKGELVKMLNKNQLYVNLSEIDDSEFKISKEDKELNKNFYN